jgi:DNA-binding transcriptional ArsR family regulator
MVQDSTQDSGGKITLDQDTFKVLASETRIEILKVLEKSQLTVSDLSRVLNMSKATLFEHLDKMVRVGLIKKKEDHRKWVYYRLSWKGKNILHPQRTKIAIVLGISVTFLIIISIFYTLQTTEPVVDHVPPEIELIDMEDIQANSESLDHLVIQVSDDKGIDESRIKVEYSLQTIFTRNLNLIQDWKPLEYQLVDDKVYIEYPNLDWDQLEDRYLYIRCTVYDDHGNIAESVYVDYIEKVYQNNKDISVAVSDIELEADIKQKEMEGLHEINFKIKLHNTGSEDLEDITISVFGRNPDINHDGKIDNNTKILNDYKIGSINRGQCVTFEFNLTLDITNTPQVWVFADPMNNINESDESNNLINFKIAPYLKPPANEIPEIQPLVIVFIIVIIIMINVKLREKYSYHR